MPKYRVTVQRTVYEEIVVEVEADDEDHAADVADDELNRTPPERWSIIDEQRTSFVAEEI